MKDLPEHRPLPLIAFPRALNPDAYLTAIYPQGPPTPLRLIRITQGAVIEDLSEARRQGVCIHAIFEAALGPFGRVARYIKLVRLKRKFIHNYFDCQLVGVFGTVSCPEVVLPLRQNILSYANSVTFRCADSPILATVKRFAGFLPGSFTWHGPVILIGMPKF